MKGSDVRYYLERTTRKLKALRIAGVALSCLAILITCRGLFQILSVPFTASWVISILAAATFFIYQTIKTNIFGTTPEQLLGYINRQFPELQESSDLLLADDARLSSLQRLQKEKSSVALEIVYPRIKLPVNLITPLAVFVGSIVAASLLFYFSQSTGVGQPYNETETKQATTLSNAPAAISNVAITTVPPPYTGQPAKEQKNLALNLVEGTTAEWNITFHGKIREAHLLFNGNDTLAMRPANANAFSAKRRLASTGFYQVLWNDANGKISVSDYSAINISPDMSPSIKVNEPEQFCELSMEDSPIVCVRSTITDDYAVRDAYIIATVSKGSGESVKFREEKLRFTQPSHIAGKNVSASMRLNMKTLGLDPGDELYFYVEAIDFKTPRPNKSRTETFFISLKDTAAMATSIDPGLGVDLMPEYFRSQRQIIIDSEKLLKEKKSITKEKFNGRSNNLGHDQKVLRLRYGEFLGEEFESSIGPAPGSDESVDAEDISKVYGHQHDSETEHTHEPANHDPGKKDSDDDPAKAYMHAHDSEEEATFFTQSIRSKLKAAITIMWDAELHLRLNDPVKSLPFQYRALKLLKEISQDSRIYVHRTGFDPPPLKEEKRLSGDLSDLRNATDTNFLGSRKNYPAIRAALSALNNSGNMSPSKNPNFKSGLIKAGNELSSIAMAQPGRYLKTLSLLKALSEDEMSPADRPAAVRHIIAAFYGILPIESSSPNAKSGSVHVLDEKFLENVNAIPSGRK
jgi:hypothetical protein